MKKYLLLLLFLVLSYNQYAQKVKYIVVEREEEWIKEVYAIYEGKKILLPKQKASPEIANVGDYNFDGYEDALIAWTHDIGNCCGDTYQIYFFDGKEFHLSKEVGYDWDGIKIAQNEKGYYRFVIDNSPDGVGYTTMCDNVVSVFAVKGYQLITLKEIQQNIIEVDKEIRSEDFKRLGMSGNDELSLVYDLDCDGKTDSIICKYWERWGSLFWKIKFADGKKVTHGREIYCPKRIGVMKSKTNGVYDLVFECDDIVKWNGETYELKTKE